MLKPLARASDRASLAIASGDFAAAGSFTRSRAQATLSAIRAPRHAGAHLGVGAAEHLHAREPRRLGLRLVGEELIAPERDALDEGLRRVAAIDRVGGGVEHGGRHLGDFRRASRDRGAGPSQRVGIERVAIAHSDQHGRLRTQAPARGNGQRLAALGLEAGLGDERGQRAPERLIDDVGAGSEQPAREHGHREEVGSHAIGCRGNDIEGGGHAERQSTGAPIQVRSADDAT